MCERTEPGARAQGEEDQDPRLLALVRRYAEGGARAFDAVTVAEGIRVRGARRRRSWPRPLLIAAALLLPIAGLWALAASRVDDPAVSGYQAIVVDGSDVLAVDGLGRERTLTSVTLSSGFLREPRFSLSPDGLLMVTRVGLKGSPGTATFLDLADPQRPIPAKGSVSDARSRWDGLGRLWTGQVEDGRLEVIEPSTGTRTDVSLPGSDPDSWWWPHERRWWEILGTTTGEAVVVRHDDLESAQAGPEIVSWRVIDVDGDELGTEMPPLQWGATRRWLSPVHGMLGDWVSDGAATDRVVASLMDDGRTRNWYRDEPGDIDRVVSTSFDAQGTGLWLLVDRRGETRSLVLMHVDASGAAEERFAFAVPPDVGQPYLSGLAPDDSLVVIEMAPSITSSGSPAIALVDLRAGRASMHRGELAGIARDLSRRLARGSLRSRRGDRAIRRAADDRPASRDPRRRLGGAPEPRGARPDAGNAPGDERRTTLGPITLTDAIYVSVACNGNAALEVAFDPPVLEQELESRCLDGDTTANAIAGRAGTAVTIEVRTDASTAWRLTAWDVPAEDL